MSRRIMLSARSRPLESAPSGDWFSPFWLPIRTMTCHTTPPLELFAAGACLGASRSVDRETLLPCLCSPHAVLRSALSGRPSSEGSHAMPDVPMLTEEDVIAAVCEYLSRPGYRIDQQCRTTQHGIDIIATQPASGVTIRIEAKGQTSNRPAADGSERGLTADRAASTLRLRCIPQSRRTMLTYRTIGWASLFPPRHTTESSSAGSDCR